MKTILVKNGSTKIFLIPEDDFDKLAIKELNGCIATIISDNLKFFDQSLSDGIVLDSSKKNDQK